MRRGIAGLMSNGIMNHINFFTIQFITTFSIRIRWGIGNLSYSLHNTFSIDPGYGNLRAGIDWSTTNWDGHSNISPPVHIPLPRTSHYIKISAFNSIKKFTRLPPQTVGHQKAKNGHGYGQDPESLIWSKMAPRPFWGYFSRIMGTRPLL
ncbi:hypothetical protein O181_073115 [Austropuccinia psidii MF-1]|uniref:Uncharacterized protein n=1 Tax=Austropuccinia psidii MF-1 TaxID=1389203 RepID=A0A9Q3F1U9_9BASI|nr:hypothetical protein [Austropuccinia psidii MF-1]